MSLGIRPAQDADLPALTRLLAQLGYALDPAEVAARLAAVRADPAHAVMVGVWAGRVVALLHVFDRPALDKPHEAVVQALVVDESMRGTGAGHAMMQAAEAWAAARGLTSVSLYSSAHRDAAHAFYRRLGYRETAVSHLFRRGLE